jgi:hypothetical protein
VPLGGLEEEMYPLILPFPLDIFKLQNRGIDSAFPYSLSIPVTTHNPNTNNIIYWRSEILSKYLISHIQHNK